MAGAQGGWAGDPKPVTGKSEDAEELLMGAQQYGETIDRMIHMNLVPVVAASFAAQKFMGSNGMFHPRTWKMFTGISPNAPLFQGFLL